MSGPSPAHPIENECFLKSFYMISRLGYGSFGYAILAKYRKDINQLLAPHPYKKGTLMEPLRHHGRPKPHSDGLVAIKVMKNVLKKPEDYLRVNEIKFILAVPSHENLLQIFDIFIDTLSGKLNIVMEPMNQNLYQFIQKHDDRSIAPIIIKSMLTQLLAAIRHIHSHGYFHRDVKPENILVTSTKQYFNHCVPDDKEHHPYILKLCDYGLSRHVTNTRDLTQYVSTRWYRAPEILLRNHQYSQPIDIWAFASVAAELVNRRPLFAGANESDQIWQILTKLGHPSYEERSKEDLGGMWEQGEVLADKLGFVIPSVAGQSILTVFGKGFEELAQTLQACLMWDPEKRPTAEMLCESKYFGLSQSSASRLSASLVPPTSALCKKTKHNPSGTAKFGLKINGSTAIQLNLSSDSEHSKPAKLVDPLYFLKSGSLESYQSTSDVSQSMSKLHFPDLNAENAIDTEKYDMSEAKMFRDEVVADTSFGSYEILC